MSAKPKRPIRGAAAEMLAGDAPLTEAAARLALAAPPLAGPSPAVRERLLEKVRHSLGGGPTKPQAESKTEVPSWRFATLDATEGWIALRAPGVRMRELAIDRERDTAMLYVEMKPGAPFPEHVHSAPERGLVLTGDFQMGDRLLKAGDFYEAAAGTRHERLSSPSGCTGLLWVSAAAWDRWRVAMAAS